jgi:NAD(P)-dependent dehydrogenase (short-subunit alcohol dehydrogenase family)
LIGREIVRRFRRINFCGATVLITGGSRGLGLPLARRLAEDGARVAIAAQDPDELDRARDDIIQHNGNPNRVHAVKRDVTGRDSVAQAINAVRDRWGQIDVLIHNAGIIQVGPREVKISEDFEQAMRVNYLGPIYTTLAVPNLALPGQGGIGTQIAAGHDSRPQWLPLG